MRTLSDRAYRVVFYAGAGLILLSLALGVFSALRREGQLPRLSQDPLQAAQQAQGRGDLKGMRREYRSAVRVYEGNFDFLIGAVDKLARNSDFEAAGAALASASALKPRSPRLHRAAGWMLLWQRRFAESRAAFEMALQGDPSDLNAHAGLGELWLEQDRFPEAEAAFLRVLALDPWDVGVLNSLGIAYALSGRPDQAVDSFTKALKLAPSPTLQRNLDRIRGARKVAPEGLP